MLLVNVVGLYQELLMIKHVIFLTILFINALLYIFEYPPFDANASPRFQENSEYKMPKLNDEEIRVIIDKGTEAPFSGQYNSEKRDGVYLCRQCGKPLYHSEDKFDSGTGWPSFDDQIAENVKRVPEGFGRVEVVCHECGGHLGHVFEGEGFTKKNTRHCINSVSLSFVPKNNIKKAYFAGGCFWGVEANFEKIPGVIDVISGYSGGITKNPEYRQVITGDTGHAESVEVVYDNSVVDYETLAKAFFELHDPTQLNMQGFDVGTQYRSALFFNDDQEKEIAEKLIKILKNNGYNVVTQLTKFDKFYPAEDYHQNYIARTGRACSLPVKRF